MDSYRSMLRDLSSCYKRTWKRDRKGEYYNCCSLSGKEERSLRMLPLRSNLDVWMPKNFHSFSRTLSQLLCDSTDPVGALDRWSVKRRKRFWQTLLLLSSCCFSAAVYSRPAATLRFSSLAPFLTRFYYLTFPLFLLSSSHVHIFLLRHSYETQGPCGRSRELSVNIFAATWGKSLPFRNVNIAILRLQ